MAKDHGPSIKDDETYGALRDRGYDKETAARIANARAAGEQRGKAGGEASPYEDRNRAELYEVARELDIPCRSEMTKEELIQTLRAARG